MLHLMIFKTSRTGYFRFSKRHKENFPWNQCTFWYQQISFSLVCKWVRLCHDTPSLLACPNLGPTYCFCFSTLNYRSGFFNCLQLNRLETKESDDLVQDVLMKLITLSSSLGHKTTFFFPTHRFYQHPHLLIQCNLFRSGTTNHLGEPDFTYQGRNQTASVCDHACRWAPQCLRVTRSWSLKQILHQHRWWRTEISKEPTHKEQRFFLKPAGTSLQGCGAHGAENRTEQAPGALQGFTKRGSVPAGRGASPPHSCTICNAAGIREQQQKAIQRAYG